MQILPRTIFNHIN